MEYFISMKRVSHVGLNEKDEKVTEVIERIKELLDLALEEDDLDLNTERNASKSSYIELSWMEYFISMKGNWNCLGQFSGIPWYQTMDVHRGSTLRKWH